MTQPTQPPPNPLLHHATRLSLALVFIWAGAAKMGDMTEFAARVGDFGLVFDSLVVPAAWTVTLAELVTGLALAVNLRGSLSCAFLLLTLFSAALIYGIVLGLDIDCGCFGPGYHVSLPTQLLVDFGLLLWCGIVHWSGKRCRVETIGLFPLRFRVPRRRKPAA